MWTILFVLSWAFFCMEFALWEEEKVKKAIEREERKRSKSYGSKHALSFLETAR